MAGRGRLFLLVGEPGIGKSRLAEELTSRARARGALVLVGRCWEAGGAPAYWPWVQSLRAYVRRAEPAALRTQLGPGAADVAQLLPELRDVLADLPPAPTAESEGARFRLFDSLTAFLKSVAVAQPLVLVLDDLHAADEPSLLLAAVRGPRARPEPGHDRRRLPRRRSDAGRPAQGDPRRAEARAGHAHPDARAGWPRPTSPASSRSRPPRSRPPSWVRRCTPRPRATRCSSARSCSCSARKDSSRIR